MGFANATARPLRVALLALTITPAFAGEVAIYDGPIIDMHMHALPVNLGSDGKQSPIYCYPAPQNCVSTAAESEDDVMRMTIEAMNRHGIVRGFLSGSLDRVARWKSAAPGRFIGSPLIYSPSDVSIDDLRRAYVDERLHGLGELGTQYRGIRPNDLTLEPFFALAEEFDVPAHIHTAGFGARTPGFRVAAGNPILLEDVLVRHPKLRLFVENSGFPFASEMIAMMYQYPQLYGDISTATWIVDRDAFLHHLKRLTDAGLSDRIMFGSDQMVWPETITLAIESIQSVDFLSVEQKADIFYNNAARFLRLSDEQIAADKAR